MPIFEYICNKCSEEFERLVYTDTADMIVQCPKCSTKDIKKKFSLFGMRGVEKQTSSGCSSCSSGSCSTCK